MARRAFFEGRFNAHALALCICLVFAAAAHTGAAFATAEGEIPRRAWTHRSTLIRAAHAFWGLDAPTASFAAQVHAESRWRPGAVSNAGAQGMAQFMPGTARWIADTYPHLLGCETFNPGWSLQALVTYDRYLWERLAAANPCERMAKTLAAYNGGLGWVRRDERLARRNGLDDSLWFAGVETVNSGRKKSAKRENQAYPRTILLRLEPLYMKQGFGRGMCHE